MNRFAIDAAPGVPAATHKKLVAFACEAVIAALVEDEAPGLDGLRSLDRREIRSLRLVRSPGARRLHAETILAGATGLRLAGLGRSAPAEDFMEARAAIAEYRGRVTTAEVAAVERRDEDRLRLNWAAVRSLVSTLEVQFLENRLPRVEVEPDIVRAILGHYAGRGVSRRERSMFQDPR